MIYLVRSGDRIKIGHAGSASRARARFNAIRDASPVEVELLGVIDGSRDDEQELHRRFAGSRLHGEWFMATPELLSVAATSGPLNSALPPNINLPLPDEMLEAIDQARGDIPRTVWIRRAIEQRLSAEGTTHGS
jgi:hypothetical protein